MEQSQESIYVMALNCTKTINSLVKSRVSFLWLKMRGEILNVKERQFNETPGIPGEKIYLEDAHSYFCRPSQRWALTLASPSIAQHLSKTRPLIERSERLYFFEKLKAKIVPFTVIVVDHDV
jgi:hypothetical protein